MFEREDFTTAKVGDEVYYSDGRNSYVTSKIEKIGKVHIIAFNGRKWRIKDGYEAGQHGYFHKYIHLLTDKARAEIAAARKQLEAEKALRDLEYKIGIYAGHNREECVEIAELARPLINYFAAKDKGKSA